ncbi:MAG: VOC family protein [Rhodobacteraceae bacterium]|nr:VOC family protein [Paracoccaceae bacterium]
MHTHHMIDYVEFPCRDFNRTKEFFGNLFGWKFTDYGPGYTAFSAAGLEGGFYASDLCSESGNGSALIVLYSEELETTQSAVQAAGGVISTEIFSFPGGRRFHFLEPSGNELAVWSDR